jgi:hypothetical protein
MFILAEIQEARLYRAAQAAAEPLVVQLVHGFRRAGEACRSEQD